VIYSCICDIYCVIHIASSIYHMHIALCDVCDIYNICHNICHMHMALVKMFRNMYHMRMPLCDVCDIYNICHMHIDRKKPHPPGGFSIYYVPWSRAVCKRFHDDMRRSHLVVESLTHGSWSGNIVNRKPPRGGGVLSINMALVRCFAICIICK